MFATRRRWWFVVAGCVVLAGAIVVALTSTGSSGGSRHPAAAATAPSSPAPGSASSPVRVRPIPTGSFNAAATNILDPSTKTGGTLRLLATEDCDSWDPARTTLSWCWNLQRLITRTLVGYSTVDGDRYRIAPDLATSLGRHNSDYTQWTYTLKRGLRFSTGRPIRPIDVKYGIERLFATHVIQPGVPEFRVESFTDPAAHLIDAIAHPNSYRGPYRGGALPTITTTAHSITFQLSRPDADFDHLMTLPASAPVPYRVEGGPGRRGANYQKHPVASGPFEIRSYRPNKSIVFARNPHWQQDTDTIRHPLVHSVRLRIDPHFGRIDRELHDGRADARADGGVQAEFRRQILQNPKLKQHADDPVAPATRYVAFIPSAVKNVHCRRAIFYALDKSAVTRVFGGPTSLAPATSMTPPGIAGYDPAYNPYPSGARWTGAVAKAKAELRACGKPTGFSVRLGYGTPSETGPLFFQAVQYALARVGIKVVSPPSMPSTFYGAIGSPKLLRRFGVDLVPATWFAPAPTGYAFYHRVDTGQEVLPDYAANLRSLHDATIDRVLAAAARGRATEADWRALDRAVMASAMYLPFGYEKTLYYRNPRMTNVTCDNALASGIYDFVNVGVR